MAIKNLQCVTVVVLCLVSSIVTVDPSVTTKVGTITGKNRDVTFPSGTKKKIVEFLGIPFAEPPTGKLRFQKPVAKAKFTKTFVAKEYGPSCVQHVHSNGGFQLNKPPKSMGEDCLSLNIHKPIVAGLHKLPVMIFIYGGAYVNGQSSTFDGGYLSSYGEVIVVTINYRLGPLGFLSTGDDAAPGNAGLWDQQLAIKWVNDNIDKFGGDTTKITVFGQSAGSSSVAFQTLYPKNKGLFQRAIAESGAASAFWSSIPGSKAKGYAKQLAMDMNCTMPNGDNSQDIVTCLRNSESATVLTATAVRNIGTQWVPVIDNDFILPATLAALQRIPPTTQLPSQNYDMIVGSNGYDGHYFLITLYAAALNHMKMAPTGMFPMLFRGFVRQWMKPLVPDPVALEDVADGAVFAYTNAENPNNMDYNLKQASNFVTDSLFFIPSYHDVVNHAYKNTKTKTYQYEFNHKYPLNITGSEWLLGATHGGELPYIFGFPSSFSFSSPKIAKAGEKFSKVVMDYWTNFAKTGDPNSPTKVVTAWERYDLVNKNYLNFPMVGNPEKGSHLNSRRVEFWTNYVPILMKPRTNGTSHVKTCVDSSSLQLQASSCIVISLFMSFHFLLT